MPSLGSIFSVRSGEILACSIPGGEAPGIGPAPGRALVPSMCGFFLRGEVLLSVRERASCDSEGELEFRFLPAEDAL